MNNVFLGFLLFVLPLGADTFTIAAAIAITLGAGRLAGSTRWRISAVFVVAEAGMPLVGFALGSSIGHTVGSIVGYFSGSLLVLLGDYLWWVGDDGDELAKLQRLASARGLALLGLALAISLDELAIGFSLGLGADIATPATIVATIAIQALVVSQLGLSFGVRLSERARERIERLVGPLLIVLGGYLLAEKLIHIGLITTRHAEAVGTVILILSAVALGVRHARVVRTEIRPVAEGTAPSPTAGKKSAASYLSGQL